MVRELYEKPEAKTSDLIYFKDGRVFERISKPMYVGSEPKGRVWSFLDITERKQAEDKLIIAKEKAEESDRLKTAFLNNISHEIRTPFNVILGFLSILQDEGLTSSERDEYISTINESASRLLNTISIGLPGNIECIYTDGRKLNTILSNLISNAIKFTRAGSIEFGYKLKEAGEPAELEFSVKDTGMGIPEYKHQAIFERFMQVDVSNTRQFEGSGLGLSIAKAYVEMLGGNIWIESEEGKGSTFYFTIPYQAEPASPTLEPAPVQ